MSVRGESGRGAGYSSPVPPRQMLQPTADAGIKVEVRRTTISRANTPTTLANLALGRRQSARHHWSGIVDLYQRAARHDSASALNSYIEIHPDPVPSAAFRQNKDADYRRPRFVRRWQPSPAAQKVILAACLSRRVRRRCRYMYADQILRVNTLQETPASRTDIMARARTMIIDTLAGLDPAIARSINPRAAHQRIRAYLADRAARYRRRAPGGSTKSRERPTDVVVPINLPPAVSCVGWPQAVGMCRYSLSEMWRISPQRFSRKY